MRISIAVLLLLGVATQHQYIQALQATEQTHQNQMIDSNNNQSNSISELSQVQQSLGLTDDQLEDIMNTQEFEENFSSNELLEDDSKKLTLQEVVARTIAQSKKGGAKPAPSIKQQKPAPQKAALKPKVGIQTAKKTLQAHAQVPQQMKAKPMARSSQKQLNKAIQQGKKLAPIPAQKSQITNLTVKKKIPPPPPAAKKVPPLPVGNKKISIAQKPVAKATVKPAPPAAAPQKQNQLGDVMAQVLGKYKDPQAEAAAPVTQELPEVAQAPVQQAAPQVTAPPKPAMKKITLKPAKAAVKAPTEVKQSSLPEISNTPAKKVGDKEEEVGELNEQSDKAKYEEQIMAQAKAFADQQLKQQTTQAAKGGSHISAAALALNNAEMGISAKVDTQEERDTKVLSISTDSLTSDSDKANQSTENETATIAVAKEAAQSYVKKHPAQTLFEKDVKGPVPKQALELDQSAEVHIADKVSKEAAQADQQDNSPDEDLQVPQWPHYQDPTSQLPQIKQELEKVSQETENYEKLHNDADAELKQKSYQSLSEFPAKQKEIELQHQSTVNKIKGEIWTDRKKFLQKIIKLEDNHKAQTKDEDTEAVTQTLTQESMQEGVLKKKKHQKQPKDTEDEDKDSQVAAQADTTAEDVHADSFDDLKSGKFERTKSSRKSGKYSKSRKNYDLDHEDLDNDDDSISGGKDVFRHLDKQFRDNGLHYEHMRDYDDNDDQDRRVSGISEDQWKERESKEQQNLEELQKKDIELKSASKEIESAERKLLSEKSSIDQAVQEKMKQAQQIKKEFDLKAAARAEAERKAAEERERQVMQDKKDERERRRKLLKETEDVEQKASELHRRDKELRSHRQNVREALYEVQEEMNKVTDELEEAKKQKHISERRQRQIKFKKLWYENKEHHQRLREQQRQEREEAERREEERRRSLESQCKPKRVRKYACDEDGLRMVKTYYYKYDFEQDQCVEKIKKRQLRCSSNSSFRDDDDDEDDRQVDQGGDRYADDFADAGKHRSFAQKSTKDDKEEEIIDSVDDEAPPVPEKHHQNTSQKEIKKLAKHIGQIEGKVSEISKKYEELKKKAQEKVAERKAEREKEAKEAQQKAEKEAADKAEKDAAEKAEKEAAEKEKIEKAEEAAKKLENDQKEKANQIAQEKASHAQIDQQEITDQKEQTKTTADSFDKKGEGQDAGKEAKIEKFAKMLKKLNGYKQQYKKANSKEDKGKIHNQVAEFTQKWLDAKNLQLKDNIDVGSIKK